MAQLFRMQETEMNDSQSSSASDPRNALLSLVLAVGGISACTSAVAIANDDPSATNTSSSTTSSGASTSDAADSPALDDSTTAFEASAGETTSSASTSSGDETASPAAELSFEYLGPPTLQVGSTTSATIVVSNVGSAPAADLSPEAVSLSIVETDCSDVLDAGDDCRIRVELSSLTLGPVSAGVVVAYSDDLGLSEGSIVLDLDNQGDSGNLLPDSGFESCPEGDSPTGWVSTVEGEWACLESWSNFQPRGGNRMLGSGYGPFGEGAFRLSHVVDLKPYAHAIATGAAGLAVRGYYASGYGDQQRLEVLEWNEEFEDSWIMGTEFAHTDLDWVEFDERQLLSSSSGSVTLSFECLQIEGKGSAIPHCNAYFDSFEVRFVYPLY